MYEERKGIICSLILTGLCCLVVIGCAAAKNQSYNDTAESYNEKAENFNVGKHSIYFEKFDSEIKGIKGNKYVVKGTANLIEDDENAVLVKINTNTNTKISITGSIEYKNGEADLYLVTPSLEKKCILSKEVINENKGINKTIDLEEGCNKIIFKGENCIVDFNLKFVSENTHSIISFN